MAGLTEVDAGVRQAREKASETLGALRQAQSQLEEAQALTERSTEGTRQNDAAEAIQQLAQAVSSLNEVQQMVKHAMDTLESIGQRL